jgi:hypothetical protein
VSVKRSYVIGFVVLAASMCFADSQGRDFSGRYLWRDPIELRDQVNVHVEMTVRNSNQTVQDAQILLKGQYNDRETSIFVYSTTIEHDETVTFKGELLISKDEFALWKKGLRPLFVIRVAEAGGYRDQILDLIPRSSAGATL